MKYLSVACAWVVYAAWLVACASVPPVRPVETGPRPHAVKVVSNGWHTAIVVPVSELAATGLLPEVDDFPTAAFLEFGWGDRVYYPAREKTFGMALDAALTATPAVMHMAGLARAPDQSEVGSEVVSLALTEGEFQDLSRAISADFKRPEGGRASSISPGLYPNSYFYHAYGSFHLFNTCNTWTARMLRAASVNLSPAGVTTADELMSRLHTAVGSN